MNRVTTEDVYKVFLQIVEDHGDRPTGQARRIDWYDVGSRLAKAGLMEHWSGFNRFRERDKAAARIRRLLRKLKEQGKIVPSDRRGCYRLPETPVEIARARMNNGK